MDLALLLPVNPASPVGFGFSDPCRETLEEIFGRTVDLINLRRVSTVLQKEVLASERRLFFKDKKTVLEFETMVLSAYQKLQEERKDLINDFIRTGRAYPV